MKLTIYPHHKSIINDDQLSIILEVLIRLQGFGELNGDLLSAGRTETDPTEAHAMPLGVGQELIGNVGLSQVNCYRHAQNFADTSADEYIRIVRGM